jgi:hypothetical protein
MIGGGGAVRRLFFDSLPISPMADAITPPAHTTPPWIFLKNGRNSYSGTFAAIRDAIPRAQRRA